MQRLSRVTGQALDLDLALQRVLEILAGSLAIRRATISLWDPEAGRLTLRASLGLNREETTRGIYRPDEGIIGRVFRTGVPVSIIDVSREPEAPPPRPGGRTLGFVGSPILLDQEAVGVLHVDRLYSKEVDPEEDVRFLATVAGILGQFVLLNRQVEVREKGLRQRLSLQGDELRRHYNGYRLLGDSRAMENVRSLLAKVAPSKATVLLMGEPGAGKTLTARLIHRLSRRAEAPFVKINCHALPEIELDSELFGHERGALPGSAGRPGRVEQARGGTVFLYEVSRLSPALQAKLLRFMADREFERLGSVETRKADVRIIAATGRDLEDAVRDGSFREDLFYRLNVFPIGLPALRDHAEDIPLLVDQFLDCLAREHGRRLSLAAQAHKALTEYRWPKNVLELKNLLERLVLTTRADRVGLEDLPSFLFYPDGGTGLESSPDLSRLEEMEKREVLAALEHHRWVQSHAADELGITLRQLGYRIKKFGLEKTVKERRQRVLGLATAGTG